MGHGGDEDCADVSCYGDLVEGGGEELGGPGARGDFGRRGGACCFGGFILC